MSTHQGNNPTTGTARPEAAQQAEADAKAAKAAAVDAQKQAQKLDREIGTAFKTVAGAVDKLAQKLAQMKQSGLWASLINADTGKPFTSFAKYLESKSELLPGELPKTVRTKLIKDMADYGMSVSERAIAAGVSRGTASQVANSEDGKNETAAERKARTGGDGTVEDPKVAAGKAVKQLERALERVRDTIADMDDEQLSAVIAASVETVNVARGVQKLRGQSAAQRKGKQSRPTPAVAAAQPAPVAVSA